MKIAHKAFIDLENGLADKTQIELNHVWAKFRPQLTHALTTRNWGEANRIIDTLNTDGVVYKVAQYAQTIGMASMLLGASRLGDIGTSVIAKNPPEKQLMNGVTQWGYNISRNLTQVVKQHLHKQIAKLEHETEQTRHTIKKYSPEESRDYIGKADTNDLWTDLDQARLDSAVSTLVGKAERIAQDYTSLTASLMVSRMSSFGFLSQAYSNGVEQYQISAVLDDKTCPVCEALDGKIFNVKDGVAIASSIMDAEDADSLKSIAPWPSQSKHNVADLADADAQDLVDQGLQIPPYHPGCRCITVDVTDNEESAAAPDVTTEAKENRPRMNLATLTSLLGITEDATIPIAHHHGHGIVVEVDSDEALPTPKIKHHHHQPTT